MLFRSNAVGRFALLAHDTNTRHHRALGLYRVCRRRARGPRSDRPQRVDQQGGAEEANDRDPALVAKAEILLDRAHVSSGEIDGLDGDIFHNDVRAFQQVNRLPVSGDLDAATWGALMRDGAPIFKAYTITLADAAGPFTRAIPSNLEAMARLPGLSPTPARSRNSQRSST